VKNKSGGGWSKPPRGFLVGIDGGKIKVRHRHAALNTLLQSAGAIIMKMALVVLDKDLQALGLVPSVDYEFCANVHDEWQIDVLPQHVELVMKTAEEAIKKAGDELTFACPLAGNADRGANWKDTH
jgi:DNA polymerase I-like protein with 3'-5' exonuclease and polymerase domains